MNSRFLSDAGWYDDLEPARTIVTGRICKECGLVCAGPHQCEGYMLPTPEQAVEMAENWLRWRRIL